MTFPKVTLFNRNADGAHTAEEALAMASLDFRVEKQQTVHNGFEVPGKFTVVRTDTGQPLGIVGNKYRCVQNDIALAVATDIVASDETGASKFSTVGMYDNGTKLFASVDLGRPSEIVPGDSIGWYYVLSTSHDGSTGIRQFITTIRPVCDNTHQAGIQDARANDRLQNIRHTDSAEARLQEARQAFANTLYTKDEMVKTLRDLATVQLTRETMNAIMDRLFPMKTAEELATQARKDNGMEKRRTQFLELFEYNDDNAFPIIRGTAYNALNAIDEMTDHYEKVIRTSSRTGQAEYEIRQEKAIFGTGSEFKAKALEVILDATRYAPRRSMPITVAMAAPLAPPPTVDNRSLLDMMLS